jgi:hypothetical protein
VFDLDAGPVTIKLPDAGKRFMSLIVIDEDQYVPAVYYGGSHTFSKKQIGTRYLMLAKRTLVDPSDPKDIQQAHALQDAVTVNQGNSGKFEIPAWDPVTHKKVKDALLVLASTLPDSDRGFGTKSEVDPVRRLILSASAWGGNPDKEAKYLNVFPSKNDGNTVYRLNVKNVPVDGFWSISVYNADGNFQKNVFAQQHYRQEECGRIGCGPIRRLRQQDPQLPADHARLELHGALLSSASRNSERQMEIPGTAAGDLTDPKANVCLWQIVLQNS